MEQNLEKMSIRKQLRDRISQKKEEDAAIEAKERSKYEKLQAQKTVEINQQFKALKKNIRLLVPRLTFLEQCLIECAELKEFQDFLERKFRESSEHFNMAKFETRETYVVLAPGDQEIDLVVRCWYAKETMNFGLGKISSKPSRLDFLSVRRPFSKILLYGNEIYIPKYKEVLSQNTVPGGYSYHTDLALKAIDAQVSEIFELIGKIETSEDFFKFLKEKVGFKLI